MAYEQTAVLLDNTNEQKTLLIVTYSNQSCFVVRDLNQGINWSIYSLKESD